MHALLSERKAFASLVPCGPVRNPKSENLKFHSTEISDFQISDAQHRQVKMPRFFTPDVDELDGEYSIKADFGTLALIPEQQSDVFHTFQSVFLKKGCYKSEEKFRYKTTDRIVVKLLSKFYFKDGRIFDGFYKHDKKHGLVTFIDTNGIHQKQEWDMG